MTDKGKDNDNTEMYVWDENAPDPVFIETMLKIMKLNASIADMNRDILTLLLDKAYSDELDEEEPE